MNLLVTFSVALVSCFFKALQNRNYNFNNWWAVVPTSCAIAACDVYLTLLIVRVASLSLVVAFGLGNGLGGMGGMWAHRRFFSGGSSRD